MASIVCPCVTISSSQNACNSLIEISSNPVGAGQAGSTLGTPARQAGGDRQLSSSAAQPSSRTVAPASVPMHEWQLLLALLTGSCGMARRPAAAARHLSATQTCLHFQGPAQPPGCSSGTFASICPPCITPNRSAPPSHVTLRPFPAPVRPYRLRVGSRPSQQAGGPRASRKTALRNRFALKRAAASLASLPAHQPTHLAQQQGQEPGAGPAAPHPCR